MAVPFRRTSKTRKRMRRTHFKLEATGLVSCPNCGEMIQSHHICPKCGFYDGKQVILTKTKKVEMKNQTKDTGSTKAKKTKETKNSKKESKVVDAEVKEVKEEKKE